MWTANYFFYIENNNGSGRDRSRVLFKYVTDEYIYHNDIKMCVTY